MYFEGSLAMPKDQGSCQARESRACVTQVRYGGVLNTVHVEDADIVHGN